MHGDARWFSLLAILALGTGGLRAGESPEESGVPIPADGSALLRNAKSDPRWGVLFGVALITDGDIGELFTGEAARAEGPAGGELYELAVSYRVHRVRFRLAGCALAPELEAYGRLTLVDQNGTSLFPDYNAGIGFRWVDFPWNRWVHTTLFTAIGLSYSTEVYEVDSVRHPGEERSRWKFDWPIELTLAPGPYPRHQLVLFIDHQSGGHLFDEGGVNSVGLGYRFRF